MSYWIQGIFGAAAVSLTCGAVELASGHDLMSSLQAVSASAEAGVNRAAKSDRAAIAMPPGPTQTISITPAGLPATSVVVRVPLTHEARDNMRAPFVSNKSGRQKPMVACEPVVSVLTKIVKKLEPGRCLA